MKAPTREEFAFGKVAELKKRGINVIKVSHSYGDPDLIRLTDDSGNHYLYVFVPVKSRPMATYTKQITKLASPYFWAFCILFGITLGGLMIIVQ